MYCLNEVFETKLVNNPLTPLYQNIALPLDTNH
jgi:hypothetical protein